MGHILHLQKEVSGNNKNAKAVITIIILVGNVIIF